MINLWHRIMKVLVVVLLLIASSMVAGICELKFNDYDRTGLSLNARFIDELAFPPHGCVSQQFKDVYACCLLLVWVPACTLFAFAYPYWQLSLQLGVALAKDDVDDLMKDLGPLAALKYDRYEHVNDGTTKEPGSRRVASNLGQSDLANTEWRDIGKELWTERVSGPACMLVSTMDSLSEWGPSMGASVIGFWAFALCLLPTAVAEENLIMNLLLVLLAMFPFMSISGPAHVSSSCDDLLDQLNDISFLGSHHHKDRCIHLRHSLMKLNRGQGLGFKVFSTIIDRRMMVKVAFDVHCPV